jgi:hypothetical protein
MQRALRVLVVPAALLVAGSFTGLAAQEVTPPDTVVLTGAPLGSVTFLHGTHDQAECTSCHHESRPEMPAAESFQPCTACHTQPATAPMTTSLRDAFHDARAQAGLCVDCHTQAAEATESAEAPVRCTACHIRSQ